MADEGGGERIDMAFELLQPAFGAVAEAVTADDASDPIGPNARP